jgi:hypothetical protein
MGLLQRLFQVLAALDPGPRRLQLKLRRTPSLLAASGRPGSNTTAHAADATVREVAARLRRQQCWLLYIDEQRFALTTQHAGTEWLEPVDRPTAAVAELLLDGSGAAELEQHAADEQLPLEQLWKILHWLGGC